MNKHGNVKYKFYDLINIGDKINERPNNIYSLKAAFRQFNKNRIKSGEQELNVLFNEYGGKRVEIELLGFKPLSETIA